MILQITSIYFSVTCASRARIENKWWQRNWTTSEKGRLTDCAPSKFQGLLLSRLEDTLALRSRPSPLLLRLLLCGLARGPIWGRYSVEK